MAKQKKKYWYLLKEKKKFNWSLNFFLKSELQYVAARVLWFHDLHWESSFFMTQSLENLLKAIYIQNSTEKIGINKIGPQYRFTRLQGHPLNGHSLGNLEAAINKLVPGFSKKIRVLFKLPKKKSTRNLKVEFFDKYQQGSRYWDYKTIDLPFDIVYPYDDLFFKIRNYFNWENETEKKSRSLFQTALEKISSDEEGMDPAVAANIKDICYKNGSSRNRVGDFG